MLASAVLTVAAVATEWIQVARGPTEVPRTTRRCGNKHGESALTAVRADAIATANRDQRECCNMSKDKGKLSPRKYALHETTKQAMDREDRLKLQQNDFDGTRTHNLWFRRPMLYH